MAFDEEKLRMSVGIDVQVYLGDQSAESLDPELRVAGVRTVSHYLIPEDDLDKHAEAKVLLPKMFVAHLVGLSISTSRGVLVGRTHHPAFRSAPLPIGRPLDAVEEIVREGHVDWIDVEG